MSNLLAVRIPIGNRLYFFQSGPYVLSAGDHVLAHVEGDLHLGKVERVSPMADSDSNQNPPASEIPIIFRQATEEDVARGLENQGLVRGAFTFCRQCILERNLDMKLVDVVALFDGSKILFYFTAPSRIDFRELVKDLVRAFRTRIELRQIGARHETQMIGGIGNCGQMVCCQRFLRQFAPATIKMAKEQNLFLNPAKISGVCNRLLCCLSYEQNNYAEFLAQCPKIGKKFTTALGSAKVIRANYFRRSVSVWLEPGGEREIELDEWYRLLETKQAPSARHETPIKHETPVKVRIVQPAVVVKGEPDDLALDNPPLPQSGKILEVVQAEAARPDKKGSDQPQPGKPREADKNSRSKSKKEGRSGSRKSKRRRSSRNRSQARVQPSGSTPDTFQSQSPGKPTGKSPGKSRKKSTKS